MTSSERKYPPTKSNKEICERLGLQIQPNMGNKDVYFLIQDAIKDPRYKALYDQLNQEKAAALEREEREEYGDELYEEIQKWEKLCDVRKHYAAVFRQGKSIKFDILELEQVEIEGTNASTLKVEALRPKKYRDREIGDYLEWEKEIRLKPKDILILKALPKQLDIYDVSGYEKLLRVCESWASKYAA